MSEDGLPEVLFRARLYRKDRDTPWGFRLQGGVEFNKPLTLLKVIPDSVASKVGLNAGDILVRLAGRSADSMTHRDAQQAIVNSGNSLEIIVERADVTFSSSSSSSSASFVGSTFSDKGQLTINNDLNSSETYTDEKDDLKAAGGGGEGGEGLRGRASEEGVESILESFSEKILNEISTTTTTTTTTTTKENDVSVRRISTSSISSSSSAEATPQIQLDQQHPSTSSASTTAIPDSPTTTTTTTTTTMTNNAEVPLSPTTDRGQVPLSPGSSAPSSTASGPGTHGGREPGQSNNDVEDSRQADGRLDIVENDASGVGGAVVAAVEKDGERVDEKMAENDRQKIDERLKMTDERLKMTDDRLRMTDDRVNMSTDERLKLTDDRLKMTTDDRLKMTIDDRLKMTTDDRLKMTIDDRLKMAPDALTTVATVLTDHNDNIPLDHLEEQNSFPVRALLKTSALTSELGDESSEGADDQSSEFSDDVSVIEVQGEGTTREEVAGGMDEDEDDEVDTLPDTDALFYQDETEYREISLLNFDDRFFDAASASAATGAPRSSGATSVIDPDPEGEMNRMKACFYLPSLVPPDNREPATTAVTVQSLTVPVVTSEVWGAADKSPRDFSQTAPWRVSSSKTTTSQQTIPPPRRTEDLSPTTQINTQQITWDEAKAHPIVSSYILNDPGHTGPENVIYIPISIFGTQLKLGSQYTFQRKDPPAVIAPSTSQQPAPPVGGASSPVVASPPMSLTLMGRRSEDRHAQRVIEQPPPAVVDQPPPIVVVRSSDPGQSTHTVSVAISTASPAVTMATARVYIAPVMSSQSGAKTVPVPAAATPSEATVPVVAQASPPSSSLEPPRRLSNEILPDLQDIPLPPVRDIVADLNSRLEKVAERYETSAASSASAYQVPPSTELGTSFARPERRRSSSGSDSEKEIIIDTPPFSQDTTMVRMRERLLGDQVPPAPDSSSVYRSVIYRGTPLSPKSIRRFSLPGGAMTVKDSVQRRVRFAEPPESSVIEIEGRQRRWPTGERIRSAVGDRIIRMRDDADAIAAEAEYVSVSSLAEKLDRIELENALASAAMKRSRPFQGPPQVSVSSLLAAHPADIRASSPGRGSSGLVGRPTSWKLEPIQERVINIQTLQQPPDVRRVDERQIRIGSQKPPTPAAAAAVSGGSPSSPSVRCTSDLGGGFSVSIGPGSGGQLSLSVQQHHPNHPGQGGNRHGHSPTRVNFVLPSSELGKPDQFSYSVSAGGVVSAREPLKYTLPPTYEESVRAMASGKHPRSSSLDDAKQMSMAAAAAAAAAYPPRISELRAESQMVSGAYPAQPGLRIMRAQSPTLSHQSSQHPGWVISSVPHGAQERDGRRGYSQTLQVDTGSRQVSRSTPQQPLQPPPPSSPSYALPVYHARSGALSSVDLVGYHHHHHHATQEMSPQQQHQQQQDRLMRMMVQQQQQQQQQPPPHHPGMRQAVSGEIPRQDIAARFYRSGSPLILSPPTGFSNSGSTKSAQGTVRSFSPVSSPSGPDRRWPPSHRFPDHLGQAAQVPSPLTERRQWPTTSSPRPMTPTAQQPFVHEQPRQVLVQPSMAARPFPEASAAAAVAAGALAAQRLPGIFALLDKTFTDKVMQWEGGGGSRSSGGLQQSETYKLVREMDDAMKQDKQ